MITQRRATLILLGFTIAMLIGLLVFQIVVSNGSGFLPIMIAIGGMSGLWWLAWRGWEPAGLIAMILMTVLTAVSLSAEQLSPAVFIAPIFALVMANSRWIVISTAVIIATILIRSGGTGAYAMPVNVLLFVICIAGMLLGRQVLDNARQTAETSAAQAEQARQQAESGEREAQRQAGLLAEQNESQQRLLSLVQELEVPIITVLRGILVVPLIGALDTRRSETIESAVLQAIHSQRATTVIIDLTAVTLVDTAIAQRLLALTRAIQLLGAEPVLTGLGASLAQTLVSLGITLAGIKTYASLQAVLEDTERRANLAQHPLAAS